MNTFTNKYRKKTLLAFFLVSFLFFNSCSKKKDNNFLGLALLLGGKSSSSSDSSDDDKKDNGNGDKISFSFDKLSVVYKKNGSISESQIFDNVRPKNEKTGYSLKEIKDLSPADIVSNNGKSLQFTKQEGGEFTATLVFDHATKPLQTIVKAEFKVVGIDPTNQKPQGISLSNNSILENRTISTVIGSFDTADPTPNDSWTYPLVSGEGSDDNGDFTIDGNKLKSGKIFDYETKNSYKIRVRTTDKTNEFFEKKFTISIKDMTEEVRLDLSKVNDLDVNYKGGVYDIFLGPKVSSQALIFGDFILNPELDNLTFMISSAFLNGDLANDRKSRFIIEDNLAGKKILKFKAFVPNDSEYGYYRINVSVQTPKYSFNLPLNMQLFGTRKYNIDASSVSDGIKLRSSDAFDSNLKTGSGNDILQIGYKNATSTILNGGTGDDTYRFASDAGSGVSVHNFGAGDQVQVKTTWVSISVYNTEASVVATGTNRYIFTKDTGKLYRDENGNGVWDAGNSLIDLKSGTNDKKVATFYNDTGTILYTDFKPSQIEYKNFN